MDIKKIIYIVLLSLSGTTLFSQVVITEIYYDTPYSEFYERGQTKGKHHLGEYIELYNYSKEDLPLKGWSISDIASKYTFPDNVIIPAESFLLIAYRDPYYLATTGNYFPSFFPTTSGKEAQIIYQGAVMFRNKLEQVNLNMGFVRGTDFKNFKIHSARWYNTTFDINNSQETNPANINFYLPSLQLGSNGEFHTTIATPLTANYVPPTQNLEDILTFIEATEQNYSDLTWEINSNALLNNSCPLTITIVDQNAPPIDSTLGKCFEYDGSGNAIKAIDCNDTEPTDPISPTTEYNPSELEEINSKIALYPNPTNSVVNASWDGSINGVITGIQVFNMAGILIVNIPVHPTQSTVIIDLSSQPTGICMVKFILNTGQIISRNVIKI